MQRESENGWLDRCRTAKRTVLLEYCIDNEQGENINVYAETSLGVRKFNLLREFEYVMEQDSTFREHQPAHLIEYLCPLEETLQTYHHHLPYL